MTFAVTVMCFLYYRIWRETKKRQKDLPNLQAGGGGGHQSIKKDSSKRSNSRYEWRTAKALELNNNSLSLLQFSFSDETSTINHQIGDYIDPNFWHPPHLAGDNESNSYYSGAHPHSIHDMSRRTSVSSLRLPASFAWRNGSFICSSFVDKTKLQIGSNDVREHKELVCGLVAFGTGRRLL